MHPLGLEGLIMFFSSWVHFVLAQVYSRIRLESVFHALLVNRFLYLDPF